MKIKINKIFSKDRLEHTTDKRRNISTYNECTNKRRNVEVKKGIDLFKLEKKYYSVFTAMVVIAVFGVYTNFFSNKEEYDTFTSSIEDEEVIQVNNNQDITTNNQDTRKEEQEVKKEETKKQDNSIKKVETKPKEVVIPKLEFVAPIKGEIIKPYSNDKVIYSNTLESWKTHNGIDIKTTEKANIVAIEKGIIERIYIDSFYGSTVIIDHGQGYKSIYSNVECTLKEKVTVNKNQSIGKVKYDGVGEIKDDVHIHFVLMQNNEVTDPTKKIKL